MHPALWSPACKIAFAYSRYQILEKALNILFMLQPLSLEEFMKKKKEEEEALTKVCHYLLTSHYLPTVPQVVACTLTLSSQKTRYSPPQNVLCK